MPKWSFNISKISENLATFKMGYKSHETIGMHFTVAPFLGYFKYTIFSF